MFIIKKLEKFKNIKKIIITFYAIIHYQCLHALLSSLYIYSLMSSFLVLISILLWYNIFLKLGSFQ